MCQQRLKRFVNKMTIFCKPKDYDYMSLTLPSPKLNGNITQENILGEDLTQESHLNLTENQMQSIKFVDVKKVNC